MDPKWQHNLASFMSIKMCVTLLAQGWRDDMDYTLQTDLGPFSFLCLPLECSMTVCVALLPNKAQISLWWLRSLIHRSHPAISFRGQGKGGSGFGCLFGPPWVLMSSQSGISRDRSGSFCLIRAGRRQRLGFLRGSVTCCWLSFWGH